MRQVFQERGRIIFKIYKLTKLTIKVKLLKFSNQPIWYIGSGLISV